MQQYLLSERRKTLINTVRFDVLQVNIVQKTQIYHIYIRVLYYIGNISIMLDFRPTQIHDRNYHNDAKRAITTNYVFVSDKKILELYHRKLISSKICVSIIGGEM